MHSEQVLFYGIFDHDKVRTQKFNTMWSHRNSPSLTLCEENPPVTERSLIRKAFPCHDVFMRFAASAQVQTASQAVGDWFWIEISIVAHYWLEYEYSYCGRHRFRTRLTVFKSLMLRDACTRLFIGSSLLQIMVCRMFRAKPLSEPVVSCYQLCPYE